MIVAPATLASPGRPPRGRPVPVHDAGPAPQYRLTTAALKVLKTAARPSQIHITAVSVAVIRKRIVP